MSVSPEENGLPAAAPAAAAPVSVLEPEPNRRLRPPSGWVVVHNELSASAGRALHELRTIQYLEETVGPAGLRRLADALGDDEHRATVQNLRRRAASTSLELESIIEDWNAIVTNSPRRPTPAAVGGLDSAEIVESFVEVKRASAELLRRAAKDAPTPRIKERLLALAEEEDFAAQKLLGLYEAFPQGDTSQ